MKRFILTTLSFTTVLVFGQNWSPIQTNEKMNYQHSDSSYISHTIWIDEIDLNGPDTTFFLNRIVKDHPTDIDKALRNQPQFLFAAMSKLNDGIYHFEDSGYYILKTWATLGDTWLFDPDNNLQATVSGLLEEEIMGVLDSIKVISLSGGSEINLSKSFGIIQFPDFENGGFYELVGIQDSEYGESVPDFWDIYNFEIGDVFQYYEDLWVYTTNIQTTRKITITDKTVNGNILSYNIDGIYLEYVTDFAPPYPPPSYFVYQYTSDIEFNFENDLLANKFPNELVVLPDSESQTGTGQVFVKTHIYFDESLNTISKRFGMEYSDETAGALYYDLNEDSDTIYKYTDVWIYAEPCVNKGQIYSNQLGNSYYAEGCLDSSLIKFIEGYVKNGDTIGTITPDSTLLAVSIEDSFLSTETIKVYPNPASNVLNISFLHENVNTCCLFEIRNLQGVIFFQKEVTGKGKSIDVSELKPGIYFFTFQQHGAILKRGKILIN